MLNRMSNWGRILTKTSVLSGVVILADFVLVSFFGSRFWYYGYFFGSDFGTTMSVLMLIEGAVIIAIGVGVGIRSNGSVVFYGKYGKIYHYTGSDNQKPQGEQIENQDGIGLLLLLAGGVILIASFILVLI